MRACSKSGPKAKFDATTEKQRALNAEAREVFYLYRLAPMWRRRDVWRDIHHRLEKNVLIYWVTIAACGALMETLWGFACRRLRVCKLFSSKVFGGLER